MMKTCAAWLLRSASSDSDVTVWREPEPRWSSGVTSTHTPPWTSPSAVAASSCAEPQTTGEPRVSSPPPWTEGGGRGGLDGVTGAENTHTYRHTRTCWLSLRCRTDWLGFSVFSSSFCRRLFVSCSNSTKTQTFSFDLYVKKENPKYY